MPVQWCDDRVCLSFARCRRPSRMPLRCGPVGGCAKSYPNYSRSALISAQLHGRQGVCLYGDLVVATGVAHSMLRRAPKPTAVSAVWRSMCCTRSACTGDSAVAGVITSSFFVTSFVGHRPIFWGNYFSSSVLYLTTTVCKQRAANCEGPNAEKRRLQFTLERQGSAVPSSGCVVKRPRRAPVKALTVYPQKRGTSRISRPYHRKITLSVVSCPPRWVNTLKAINQRARLFSAAVMLRPSMFGVFMVAASTVLHCLLLLTQERCSWCARCC